MAETVRIVVEPPAITGDTVYLRWTQSEPNPFQWQNGFFLRYDGIDLSGFSPLLFFEIFLALQLRVFAAYKRPVEIVFPRPVPHTTAAYWQAFHDARLVSITPRSNSGSYDPWLRSPAPRSEPRRFAVFFGGGRDSLATTCLLSEIASPRDLLLVQYVMPLRPGAALMEKLERRQEGLMLGPARERLGVATQVVRTDYQVTFHGLGHEKLRPHLELYTAGALPALLAHGVSLATFCIEWTQYAAYRQPDGGLDFRYARSRPEVLAAQTKHLRRALGLELAVADLNLMFSSPVAFRLLKERYPHALEQIVMCTSGGEGERWCYWCYNCAWYAMYTIWGRALDPRFDYDRLFAASPYIRGFVDYALTGVDLAESGNTCPSPSAGYGIHTVFNHVLAGIDVDVVAGRLKKEAFANLQSLKTLFGNRLYPDVEKLPRQTIALAGHPIAVDVAARVAEHVDVADELPGPWARPDVVYDFSIRMPTRMDRLDHIRN
jgi:hypothetical protein